MDKFLKEYYEQLNIAEEKDAENFDVDSFNYSILCNKKNIINSMLSKMDVKNLRNSVIDSNVISLFDGYLTLQTDFDDNYEINDKNYNLRNERYNPFTLEEEREIFIKYSNETNRAKKKKIRNEIVERNMRLVRKVANGYRNACDFLESDDLISYGAQGLMVAIDKYDYTKGFKFSTYAVLWIQQVIRRAITNLKRPIRIPNNQDIRLGKVKYTANLLYERLGREATNEEIALESGLSVAAVKDALMYDVNVSSLNVYINDEEKATLEDMIISDEQLTDELYFDKDQREYYRQMVYKKTKNVREADMILMRCGFEPYYKEYTLEEIAQKYDVTRERVRQIITRGLRKIYYELKRTGDPAFSEREKVKCVVRK